MEIWFVITLANMVIMCLLFYSKIYIQLRYKCDGSDDYIAVDVYMFRKLLAYSMQVSIIEIGNFWLKSQIKTAHSQDETHIKREKRFVKKTVKFYLLHPRRLRQIVRLIRHYTLLYRRVMNNIIKSLHCEQLEWKTILGSEDAGLTGIGFGVLWTVKALVITRLQNHVIVIQKPIINVDPRFGQNCFKVDFLCIFSIRFGNVIKAMRILYNNKG